MHRIALALAVLALFCFARSSVRRDGGAGAEQAAAAAEREAPPAAEPGARGHTPLRRAAGA